MRAGRGVSCLRMLAWILPHEERADWLEERRAFLYDLTGIREQTRWIIGDLIALPRHAYTLRTGPKKESA
jgi:hypothetical protein